ncbi:MAG: hypothetical protein ACJAUD_000231 [Crocinitomicaceae bacterium]|jgi:hypothetical protein
MKNNAAVFDKIVFPINPELDNRSSYRLIKTLAKTFHAEVEIVGSTGTSDFVDKKKWIQFNEEIKTLKAEFDGKSDLVNQQFTINSIPESYPSLLESKISAGNKNLVIFTVPFLITDSIRPYIYLIENYLSGKKVSFLLIPEKASVSSFEKVTITSDFNNQRLDLAIGIADFIQKQVEVKLHLINLLKTDEKSNSLIARYISELKDTDKPLKLTYSNKRMNINALTIDKASSIDSDLVIRIIRDELSDIRIQNDSFGVSTFDATPVLLIFE